MNKIAALLVQDKTHVVDISIADDFLGYPCLVRYQNRFFIFQKMQFGLHIGAVDSPNSGVYLEADPYVAV